MCAGDVQSGRAHAILSLERQSAVTYDLLNQEASMKETIPQYLEMHGYRGRVVSISRLRALREEIQDRHERGFIDEELYQRYLAMVGELIG